MAETVTLAGGVRVSVPALELLLSLEARGITVRLTATGGVHVAPADQLTDGDRIALGALTKAVLAILRYVDAEGWRAVA